MKGDELIELLPDAQRIGATDFYLQKNPVENGLDLIQNKYSKGKYTTHYVGFFWGVSNLKSMVKWYLERLVTFIVLADKDKPELIKAMLTKGFTDGVMELT